MGREGEVTPIMVYTNYPTAELFINGVSQEKRTKDLSISTATPRDKLERLPRYRLIWMETIYEPGTVKVVAACWTMLGNAVATKEVVTTGEPYAIA